MQWHGGKTSTCDCIAPFLPWVDFHVKIVPHTMHDAMIFLSFFPSLLNIDPPHCPILLSMPACAPLLPTSRDVVVATTEEEAAGVSDDNDDNDNDGHDDDDDEDDDAAVTTDVEDDERHRRQPI